MSLSYTHKTHPRSRSIKIKVEADGQVIVVTPKRTPLSAIDAFVNKQKEWIKQAQEKTRQKTSFYDTTQVHIFGKKYHRSNQNDPKLPHGVCIVNNQLQVNTQLDNHNHLVERFLKNTAQKYIIPRTHQLAEIMNISFNTITLRNQKTRWGSCSSNGNLNFNWRLILYQTEIIDYVIIHELAHRKHMNHSSSFWQLVARYDPNYSIHRGWLKRHGLTVG